jgi:hypothetical protein
MHKHEVGWHLQPISMAYKPIHMGLNCKNTGLEFWFAVQFLQTNQKLKKINPFGLNHLILLQQTAKHICMYHKNKWIFHFHILLGDEYLMIGLYQI